MPVDSHLLPTLGGVVTLGLGLMGLARPGAAAAFTSMSPVGDVGVSEIRATYGGFFVALGAAVLLDGRPAALLTVGAAWLGAAAGRLLSVIVDRSRSPKNLGGILFEGSIGALILAGL